MLTESRHEVCTIASKLVTVTIYRKNNGTIVNYECTRESSSCKSRCSYRMLMKDF